MPFDRSDLVSIQVIRDEWNDLPLNDDFVEQLKPFVSGDNLYQLWLEAQLMYARRQRVELLYERNAWAEKCRNAQDNQRSLAEQIVEERAAWSRQYRAEILKLEIE
jgi:hypothetical protein